MVKSMTHLYGLLMLCAVLGASIEQQLHLPTTTPQSFPIHIYQHVLGTVDGRSCPSYPVCSVYARQAFQRHGWLIASWLTLDRLIHEADDAHAHHTLKFEGQTRLDDTLQRNDFWLPDTK